MSEEHQEPTFQGPIESGKTAKLPAEPAPGEPVHKDHFFVEGLEVEQEDIKSIILPKYIFNDLNPKVGYSEKGYLLFTFNGSHKNGVFGEILRSVNEGMEELRINFLDEEEAAILSTWTFHEPTVHAIDFGYAAQVRPEACEFSVEFDYTKFDIDGHSI